LKRKQVILSLGNNTNVDLLKKKEVTFQWASLSLGHSIEKRQI